MCLCNGCLQFIRRHAGRAGSIVDYEIGGLDDLEPLLPEGLHPGVVISHGILVELAQRLFVACRMCGNVVSMEEVCSHEIVLLL